MLVYELLKHIKGTTRMNMLRSIVCSKTVLRLPQYESQILESKYEETMVVVKSDCETKCSSGNQEIHFL